MGEIRNSKKKKEKKKLTSLSSFSCDRPHSSFSFCLLRPFVGFLEEYVLLFAFFLLFFFFYAFVTFAVLLWS